MPDRSDAQCQPGSRGDTKAGGLRIAYVGGHPVGTVNARGVYTPALQGPFADERQQTTTAFADRQGDTMHPSSRNWHE